MPEVYLRNPGQGSRQYLETPGQKVARHIHLDEQSLWPERARIFDIVEKIEKLHPEPLPVRRFKPGQAGFRPCELKPVIRKVPVHRKMPVRDREAAIFGRIRHQFVDQHGHVLGGPDAQLHLRPLQSAAIKPVPADACLKAWAARESLTPGVDPQPWLLRIVRNEFLQGARRNWRTAPLDPDFAEQALVAPGAQESASDLSVIKSLIESLPEAQYEALLLVVAGGYTYEEAAEICDCSSGTIKSRVSRAREALSQLVKLAEAGLGMSITSAGDHVLDSLIDDIHAIASQGVRAA